MTDQGDNVPMLLEFLREQGADDIYAVRRKHVFIYFIWCGRRIRFVTAKTGSDWRGTMNAITDLKHLMGLVKTGKTVGLRRRKPPPKARVRRETPYTASDDMNWREYLVASYRRG